MCLRVADELEDDEYREMEDIGGPFCNNTSAMNSAAGTVLPEGTKTTPRRASSRGSKGSEATTVDFTQPEPRESRELQVSARKRATKPTTTLKRQWDPSTAVPVELHVYNIGTSGRGGCINRLLRPLGTGAFHCGVEVYNTEWSFSDTTSRKEATGVFKCMPRQCKGHTYCESVLMGRTSCSEAEVLAIMDLLQTDWQVEEYDLLRRNCCHFSDELCWRLGVGAIPAWVTNLAASAASVEDAGERWHQKAKEACTCNFCCSGAVGRDEAYCTAVEMIDHGVPSPLGPVHLRTLHVGTA